MTELAKKLHFLKNGTEQTAKAYSTVDEVGEIYAFTKIDGIDCYVPLTTKKYYKKVAWVQPALTSNTSYGTLTSDAPNDSGDHAVWRALDGNVDTWWETPKNITTAYVNWKFTGAVFITGISIRVRTGDRPNLTVRAYTDNTMTTPIGDTLIFSTAGDTKNVLNIPTDGIYTDNIYFDCSSSQDYLGICDIKITAYYFVESTKDDYDIEEWVDATNGRVIKSGTTYAIKSQAKPAYTEKSWTTSGTYTFTVPKGITRIRVAVCGGGGSGSLSSASKNSTTAKNGNSGGDSSAFGITATGGGGAKGYSATNESPPKSYVGAAGAPNGYAGNYDKMKLLSRNEGTAGFDISFTKTSGSYGKGGAGHQTTAGYYWCGGGSGGYNSDYANVTPLQTYQIIVGAAGANYANNFNHEHPTSGFVFIAFGGDI